jgi:hypothetical protein
MMNENYDFFEELYEEMIDEINSRPLTTSRLNDYSDIININENIINTVFNIRRYLEINDITSPISNEYDDTQDYVDNIYSNIQPTIESNLLNSVFEFFLDNSLNFNEHFNENLEDIKVTLTQDEFNKFNKIQISNDNFEKYNKQCNVCIEDYKINDFVIELPCKHLFHRECIENWLCKEKISCPVCRTDCRVNK